MKRRNFISMLFAMPLSIFVVKRKPSKTVSNAGIDTDIINTLRDPKHPIHGRWLSTAELKRFGFIKVEIKEL